MDTFFPGEAGATETRHPDLFAGGGEMGALMREYDWAATPLGPVSSWPQSLRTSVSICLASQFPMLILWGSEHVQIYNDAFCPILGAKHPQALGQRAVQCWTEIWEVISPLFAQILAGGEAIWSEDQPFFLERSGYSEETFFTFSYSPIRDEMGKVGGILCTVKETTRQVVGERRVQTLRELAARTGMVHTTQEAAREALNVLSHNTADLPFAALYLLDAQGKQAHLMGTAGMTQKTMPEPAPIILDEETCPRALLPFVEVAHTNAPLLISDLRPFLEQVSLISDVTVPNAALLLPIARAGGDTRLAGLLLVGISLHHAFDEEYRGFFELVASQIGTALTNARTHEEEHQRAEALAEIDRAKTTFFSNISHEFRTPLTLSLGPLELLLSDAQYPLLQEQRMQVEMVHRNTVRQLKLVNTLLDFARIEAGRAEAVFAPTDLSQVTRDLASTFQSAMEKAGLRLIVECPPLPEPIYVDPDLWEKIVLNLLSNAFKFTFEGFVRLALHPVEGGVELVVQDTGVGMREEDIPHLFERFYRAHAKQARTREGSGIGLALVQELVRLHGGSITVQSTEGVGTIFTIRLFAGYSHLPMERLGTEKERTGLALNPVPYVEEALSWLPEEPTHLAQSPASVSDSSGSMQTLPTPLPSNYTPVVSSSRVLVVDDNADMRSYLNRLLSVSYQVLFAADGAAALALARDTRPDLIISDVMMPALDGFALLKALRADQTTAAIPVILLSARAGEEATLEGLQAGANDYLVKPFSPREVLARVQAQLEITRLRREAELARQHLHDLLMQAPASICVLRGPQHVYELVNPPYYQLVGKRELLGKPIREALPELEGQGFYELLDHVYRTGEPFFGREIRAKLIRGQAGAPEEGYFDFVYQPIHTANGDVEGIMVHGVEVTEQVRARQRVSAFLGIASHELKNPLTSIKGNIDLAQRRVSKALEELMREENLRHLLEGVSLMLARAARQIDFQNRLVSDLVDTTRIQVGKLELRIAPADLNEIVREAVEEQRQLAPTRVIHLELPTGEEQRISVDADRIGQVVTNYLSNALKYSAEDQSVLVRVEPLETEIRVAVQDAGPGLSPEEQEHIWERFYRSPEVQIKSGTGIGLGLGLHICQTIIEQHGGRVGVESVKGAGSTFWFTLPRRMQDAPFLPLSE